MFPIAEYVILAELDHRREELTREFALAQRRRPRRQRWPHRSHHPIRRLRGSLALGR